MEEFSWQDLINPEFYILLKIGGVKIGLYMVLFIVFAETGLLAGFFLPGDSLLFLSGIYSQPLMEDYSISEGFVDLFVITFLVTMMGICGNILGYWVGKKSGNYLFEKEDTFWYKKKYLIQSQLFFEKYGSKTVVIARFFPIVRTFVPVLAGMVNMEIKKFMIFNVVGAVAWSFILMFSGYYLYTIFLDKFGLDLKHYIEYIILIIVIVTTIPFVVKLIKRKKK